MISIKDYRPTPEQEDGIRVHEEERRRLVEEVRKKWEEKEAAERKERLERGKKK